MSLAPPNLKAQSAYLRAVTGLTGNWFITGECGTRRNKGYHLGKSDITKAGCGLGLDGDYSTRRPTDRRWVSEYSAGFDFGSKLGAAKLKALTAYFQKQGKAGKLPGMVEYLGPRADGRAIWIGRSNGWEPVLLERGNSHEWHGHASYARKLTHPDNGFPDLIHLLEPHFGKRPGTVAADEPEPAQEPVSAEDDDLRAVIAELMADRERITTLVQEMLNSVGVEPALDVDGIFGPKTEAALEAARMETVERDGQLAAAREEITGLEDLLEAAQMEAADARSDLDAALTDMGEVVVRYGGPG